GSGEEAADQPALHDREEDEARDGREQRGGRQRSEPDDSFDSDELGELDGQGDEIRALEQDEREEELVPGAQEREQQRHDDAGREQRRDHPDENLDAASTVDRRGLLELVWDRPDVALEHPEDERERPDEVDEDQPEVRV